MLSNYLNWPLQLREALEKWGFYRVEGKYSAVAVFGMGGSGIVGDYLSTLSQHEGKYPVLVFKSHAVPRYVDSRMLSIVVSYSGNTLESLIAFKKLVERGVPVVVVSSGGELSKLAREKGILHVKLPEGLLPRASLPSMLYSILGLLDSSNMTIVSKSEAEKAAGFIESTVSDARKAGAELAEWLYEKAVARSRPVVIATHSPLEALALRFKNELNENSKLVAKVDVAPEWMHNDIVGYEAPTLRELAVVEVVDPGDAVGRKLVDFMETMYANYCTAEFYRLELRGESILEKLLYGSLIAGLASTLLATKRRLDPAETKSILNYKYASKSIFHPLT